MSAGIADYPQFVGGPLDGGAIETERKVAVMQQPTLTHWSFSYSNQVSGASPNQKIRLNGTYTYERRETDGKVRYVLVKSE